MFVTWQVGSHGVAGTSKAHQTVFRLFEVVQGLVLQSSGTGAVVGCLNR